jgi:aminotransferase EvaB
LILGDEVRAFEQEFARFVGVAHAVGVASGTDAIVLSLRALGVGPGDEVVTVANAGVPPIAAIRAVGAQPRFAEIDEETMLIDPSRIEDVITPRTRALIPVHLYGQPADVDAIRLVANAHGLGWIEDCAQAHGATRGGVSVGSAAPLGSFSFYPTKNLGGFGDGGMIVTGSAEHAESLRELRMYGFRGGLISYREGMNSRVRLVHLPAANRRRVEIARRYQAGLAGSRLRLPARVPNTEPVFHLFVVRVSDRPAVIEHLRKEKVGHGVHYPEAVHLMEGYRALGGVPGQLPVTEQACREVVSLPLYPGLEDADVDRVIDVIRSVVGAEGG